MPRHFLAFVVCYFHSVCFSVLSFVACGNGGKLRRKKAAGDMVDLFLVCLPFYSCVPLILIWFGATGRRPTGDIVGRLDMPSRLKDRLLNRTSQDPQLIPNGSIWQTLRKLHACMHEKTIVYYLPFADLPNSFWRICPIVLTTLPHSFCRFAP